MKNFIEPFKHHSAMLLNFFLLQTVAVAVFVLCTSRHLCIHLLDGIYIYFEIQSRSPACLDNSNSHKREELEALCLHTYFIWMFLGVSEGVTSLQRTSLDVQDYSHIFRVGSAEHACGMNTGNPLFKQRTEDWSAPLPLPIFSCQCRCSGSLSGVDGHRT